METGTRSGRRRDDRLACGAGAAETLKVTIKGFKFMPAEVTADVGDTIEWTNQDAMPHTATTRARRATFRFRPCKAARSWRDGLRLRRPQFRADTAGA